MTEMTGDDDAGEDDADAAGPTEPAARRAAPESGARTARLDVDRIVDAAIAIIDRDGLAGLSMRKLGAELSVDPMAVYHHVDDKRSLVALVIARTVGGVPVPDPAAPWDVRVTQWALGYWDVAVAGRELVAAGLSDPALGAAGLPSTRHLVDAVAAAGVPPDQVTPTAYVIVDAIHGSALGVGHPDRSDHDVAEARRVFAAGLATIVAGIGARAAR